MELFYSYSHRDERLRRGLESHLSDLRREGVVSWHDRYMYAGDDWKNAIHGHLDRAHIILLLISADYLSSEECYAEMEIAMKRHRENTACVIPIILRPCGWRTSLCGSLECLPTDGKPVTRWSNRDLAFQDVTEGIRRRVAALALKMDLKGGLDCTDAVKNPSGNKTQVTEWIIEFHSNELTPTITDAIIQSVQKLIGSKKIIMSRKEKGALRLVAASSEEASFRTHLLFQDGMLRIKDIYRSPLVTEKPNIENESLSGNCVLIADPDPQRFECVRHIIEDALGLQALQATTFLQMAEECRSRVEELKLVLFTERLPYSEQEKSLLLKACVEQFIGVRLATGCAAQIGLVYENEASLQDISDDECDFLLPFPHSEETKKTFLESLHPGFGPFSRPASAR